MIIYLYGPDSYRRQEKLKEIVSEYKEKHSAFSVEEFDLENKEDFDKLKDFVKAQSLFSQVKLGIVSGGSSLEKAEHGSTDSPLRKEYIALLKENLDSKEPTLVVLEEKKPTQEFKFLLDKPVLAQEFENLSGPKFSAFLQKETKKRGIIFDRGSRDLLAQVYGNNSWGLITELDKLALLDEKTITLKILENHLDASLPVNVFAVINQIRNSKDISIRLSLLEELLEKSNDPAMIFNIMAISPYADPKWKQKMADYDAAVKSGKLEYEEALLSCLLS